MHTFVLYSSVEDYEMIMTDLYEKNLHDHDRNHDQGTIWKIIVNSIMIFNTMKNLDLYSKLISKAC